MTSVLVAGLVAGLVADLAQALCCCDMSSVKVASRQLALVATSSK